MRLSEAIRIGCKRAPMQQIGVYVSNLGVSACVLGAAYMAIETDVMSRLNPRDIMLLLVATFPILETTSECPSCRPVRSHRHAVRHFASMGDDSLLAVLGHLNDKHRWNRERIADWVETVEDRMAGEAGDLEAIGVP